MRIPIYRSFLYWIGSLTLLLPACALEKNHEANEDHSILHSKSATSREGNQAAADLAAEQAKATQQQLALSEEYRKSLALRVQQLQSVLEEKDSALLQANRELQGANNEVAKTREELERWKLETAGLRERLRKSEEETVSALHSMVTTLERMGETK